MKKWVFCLLFPLFVFSQNKNFVQEDIFAVFYNVENLFDTINSPKTKDSEFLPNSEKKWDTYKYNYKLNQIEKVFSSMMKHANNDKMLDIIGLSEVENKLVIEDLLKKPAFSNYNYSIIHKDSPDSRGIDCALLFNNRFELLQYAFIPIDNPIANRPTRDIVYAQLKFKDEIINIFINHWPSRWGGQEETNHKRVFVAKVSDALF